MVDADTVETFEPLDLTYRYDVFVSYRHRGLDRRWANWLVLALESYRPPKSLAVVLRSAGGPDRIRRVFRDDDEASAGGGLSEKLRTALRESRYLVVVCSRHTPSSTWVDREVNYFESIGRANRVLPLLIDGEPGESFPRTLRSRAKLDSLAGSHDSSADVELLAADARPLDGVSSRETKRRALLKIVATALGVAYDDLYQRDRRRRLQRNRLIATGSAISLGVALTLGWVGWITSDAYQFRAVRRNAPALVSEALGEQVKGWCRSLVLAGHLDEAERAANSATDFSGGSMEALLATAKQLGRSVAKTMPTGSRFRPPISRTTTAGRSEWNCA